MGEFKFPLLSELYAKSDAMLWQTQRDLENTIRNRISSRECWLLDKMSYENEYLNAMEKCKIKGEPVTLTKEKAQKECFEMYSKMCASENVKKKFDAFIKLYTERINTIKAILKIEMGKIN